MTFGKKYINVFFRMRLSLSRVLSALCITMAVLLMWTILRHARSSTYTQTCHHSEKFQDDLHQLTDRYLFLLMSSHLYKK